MARIITGVYTKDLHVHAIGHYHDTIILDPQHRSYWGMQWNLSDFTPEVKRQWTELQVPYGERVRLSISEHGIPLTVEILGQVRDDACQCRV